METHLSANLPPPSRSEVLQRSLADYADSSHPQVPSPMSSLPPPLGPPRTPRDPPLAIQGSKAKEGKPPPLSSLPQRQTADPVLTTHPTVAVVLRARHLGSYPADAQGPNQLSSLLLEQAQTRTWLIEFRIVSFGIHTTAKCFSASIHGLPLRCTWHVHFSICAAQGSSVAHPFDQRYKRRCIPRFTWHVCSPKNKCASTRTQKQY